MVEFVNRQTNEDRPFRTVNERIVAPTTAVLKALEGVESFDAQMVLIDTLRHYGLELATSVNVPGLLAEIENTGPDMAFYNWYIAEKDPPVLPELEWRMMYARLRAGEFPQTQDTRWWVPLLRALPVEDKGGEGDEAELLERALLRLSREAHG